MKYKLKEAFLSHADGHIKKHVANVEVLLNNPRGIGEHGDIISEIEKEREEAMKKRRKSVQEKFTGVVCFCYSLPMQSKTPSYAFRPRLIFE